MRTVDFDIQVPRDMIAQEPVTPRDHSRLLVLDRDSGAIIHTSFYSLPQFLRSGDCLVFNDSRVIPARLRGHLDGSPMDEVVIVLLSRSDRDVGVWEALVEVGEVEEGQCISFTGFLGRVTRVGEKVGKRRERLVAIRIRDESKLELAGELPVPPYIHRYRGDPERYQTVYSKIRGSAAAPTAGLHFTDGLLDELNGMGIKLCFVTLHVGLDTFMPVLEDIPEEHKMYSEFCRVGKEVADVINKTRALDRRVIGVGTTSVRTMESAYQDGKLEEYTGWTSLYILPGYEFKSVDGMVTNFHYPKSTNLMMVSAFAGLDDIKRAYQEAIDRNYRFYSFGDAMLII